MSPLPATYDLVLLLAALPFGIRHGRARFQAGLRLETRRPGRDAPLLTGFGVAFIVLNAALVMLRNSNTLSWHLPVLFDYYAGPVAWALDVIVFAFLFSAILTLALLEKHRLRYAVLLLGLAAMAGGEYAMRAMPGMTGPPELRAPLHSPEGYVLQTSGSSCGAASCANVAAAFGVYKTEAEMCALIGTVENGSTNAQMIMALRRLGLKCRRRTLPVADFAHIQPPALLPAWRDPATGAEWHVVAFFGLDEGGKALVVDPLSGLQHWGLEDFERFWQGRAIEVSTP